MRHQPSTSPHYLSRTSMGSLVRRSIKQVCYKWALSRASAASQPLSSLLCSRNEVTILRWWGATSRLRQLPSFALIDDAGPHKDDQFRHVSRSIGRHTSPSHKPEPFKESVSPFLINEDHEVCAVQFVNLLNTVYDKRCLEKRSSRSINPSINRVLKPRKNTYY